MRRALAACAAGALLGGFGMVAGCAPPDASAPSPRARVFIDGLGRQVPLEAPARRIACLAPSNTEILFALGAGEAVVARDDVSDHPPAALALPAVGTTAGRLQLEALIRLEPDLVLVAEITSEERTRSLASLGLPLFYVPNPGHFDGLYDNLRRVGELCGRTRQAEELAASLRARVAAVEQRVAGRRRPRVFYELDATDPSRPWSAGPGTFIDLLIRTAGGENFCASSPEEFPRVSIETLLVGDPDVIVTGSLRRDVTTATLARRPGWSSLSAVQRGAVHAFDGDLASRPGPRLVDALEKLARLLHP